MARNNNRYQRLLMQFGAILLLWIASGSCVIAAQTNAPGTAQSNQEKPCVQPAALFSPDDYNGPFNKAVAYFTRKLEIKTVHVSHHPPVPKLCSLSASQKFGLFVENTFEPVTFVGAGFNAALSQAENSDRQFGQGMAGYGQRYGAALADNVSSGFFHTFAFPVLFRQDPRYYRRLEGTTGQRLAHAAAHTFVARADSGRKMFNFSEWLGTVASTALANTYHPGNSRAIGSVAGSVATSIGTDMAVDVLREFWPEIVRKFRLPFRSRGEVAVPASKNQKRK